MVAVTQATLQNLTGRVAALLLSQGRLIVSAESCTGGYLAQVLTGLPGASSWFDRGFVVYSNIAKKDMLDVPEAIVATYGAVSEETARAMAHGALERSRADLAVAITGIAGPDGGTPGKPVGTVHFAWAVRNGECRACVMWFAGGREAVRSQSVAFALQGVIDLLLQS
jgi:nicotinamide-nucleotide amidase